MVLVASGPLYAACLVLWGAVAAPRATTAFVVGSRPRVRGAVKSPCSMHVRGKYCRIVGSGGERSSNSDNGGNSGRRAAASPVSMSLRPATSAPLLTKVAFQVGRQMGEVYPRV